MTASLDSARLAKVFESRPDLISGIKRAADSPDNITLFNEITSHVYDRIYVSGDEPASKKRKLGAEPSNGNASGANAVDEPVMLEVKEISVSIPQRKKFELCFTPSYLYARAPGTTGPVPGIVYSWKDIEFAFYLPVPDKAQVQRNYLLFPRDTNLPSKTTPLTIEPFVFTIPAAAPKAGTIGGREAGQAAAVSDTYHSLLHWAIDRRLKEAGSGVNIVSADPNKFHSVVRPAHRPNEKAVHVGGFRGSKDGYLFFLENGILWGFKKPLIFIPLNRITAISYTSVLQITFNMVVEVLTGEGDTTEEIEFAMLDQKDFGGIDAYVKFNRLQDRSMAEQRKAKLQLAENRTKKTSEGQNDEGSATAEVSGEGEMTQLERAEHDAEQELQDDEDEEEEDYDPGSDDDSDSSGSSSEEDDENVEEGEGDAEEEEDDDEEEQEEEEEEEEEEGNEVEEHEANGGAETVKEEFAEQKLVHPPAAPPVRVTNRGWATVSKPQPADSMDTDETFDVI